MGFNSGFKGLNINQLCNTKGNERRGIKFLDPTIQTLEHGFFLEGYTGFLRNRKRSGKQKSEDTIKGSREDLSSILEGG